MEMKTARLYCKDQTVNAVCEIINGCSKNRVKPINTLCGQHTELLNVELCGTYTYH
jgi:hypothetical protein